MNSQSVPACQRLTVGPAKTLHTPAPKPARSTTHVTTGAVDRYTFLLGRAWACDMASSLSAMPVATVIERLTGATDGKPPSYVAGVQSVIEALQEASR
ncbi:hypothetical protein PSCICJ_48070 [Pseudomonas cichorii]|uniref:hypothetical protein n=1 Tax=Pseudomonas cichorii TaxID=36746 RepID=UPI00190FEAF5|nr:hypothetical protein [Pseudomonas cichorii]GFM68689.1 hypothetical protein PSCICJ_48070 [Pseudomonas cichorii]